MGAKHVLNADAQGCTLHRQVHGCKPPERAVNANVSTVTDWPRAHANIAMECHTLQLLSLASTGPLTDDANAAMAATNDNHELRGSIGGLAEGMSNRGVMSAAQRAELGMAA